MYAMSGLMAMAFISHSLVRPLPQAVITATSQAVDAHVIKSTEKLIETNKEKKE
jgi:hypothetical protein